MTLPALPCMLQPDKLRKLNKHLVDTTGCFAFLKTDQALFSAVPQSWQDAYTIFSVGLYAVYHDYGCQFLRFLLLSDDLCPNTLANPDRHRLHVDTINKTIRVNLAHGLLYSFQRTELQRKLANYYLRDSSYTHNPARWPDYVNNLTEQQWMQITRRLVTDSDKLYHFLRSWGEEWAKDSKRLPELRNRFVTHRDCFANSFDDRICRPLLLSHGIRASDVTRYTKSNGSSPIDRWRQQLIQFYRNGEHRPDEILRKLDQLIRQEFEPAQNSSIDIAAQFGFI